MRVKLLAVVGGVLAFSGPSFAKDTLGHWATITKVTDGDTVWALPDGADSPVKYRLKGFDTPEPTRYGNAECDAEAMLGDVATQAATEILSGQRLWLETDGKKGKYKRPLARIKLGNGRWFGDVMIERGLAVKYVRRSHDWCTEN